MKQIAAIYPFCAEILPVIKLFENLQKEYSLKYIISPKGFGYVEQDAAYACNHPQIGIKVLDEIPFDKDDWSTLLLFEPIMKKGDFFFNEVLHKAIFYGKQVVVFASAEQELLKEIERMECEVRDKIEIRTIRERNLTEYDEKIYIPSIPVILVGGLLEQADCFEVFLKMAEKLRNEGWNAAVFSKHPLGMAFGFYGLDHIWENSVFREEEKIRQINLYINDIVKCTCANIILLEAPDALMKYNAFIPNGYGIRTYMLCQAVTPDYLICCIPFEATDKNFMKAIGQDFLYRFGCEINAVHVANVLLDSADTMRRKQIKILRTNMEFVHQKMKQQINEGSIPIFNVVEDGIDALYDVLINRL